MNHKNTFIPRTLIVEAPAKINLHLEILGLREDGYHELAMVMQSINLTDTIKISSNQIGRITLASDDLSLSDGDDNLIIKAAKLIQKYSCNDNLGADITLQKNIPIGAGLAGGSSDAAATLLGLNFLWGLGYSYQKLELISSEIGSDIPFCISGGRQLCFGRGEILEALKFSPSSLSLLLVKDPKLSISTPWAYSQSKYKNHMNYLRTESQFEEKRNLLRNSDWLNSLKAPMVLPLKNDLQKVVVTESPQVQNAIDLLKSMRGNISVAMSGSGPSCYALFPNLNLAKSALEDNRFKFQNLGLDAWCCTLLDHGVNIVSK